MREITYTISVTLTQPIEEDAGDAEYTDHRVVYQIARDVIRTLQQSRHIEGRFDAEVMEHEIKEIT